MITKCTVSPWEINTQRCCAGNGGGGRAGASILGRCLSDTKKNDATTKTRSSTPTAVCLFFENFKTVFLVLKKSIKKYTSRYTSTMYDNLLLKNTLYIYIK
jgi:hypothetical protein